MKNSIKICRLAQFMSIIALSFLTFSGCDSSSKPKVVEPIHSCEILTVSEVAEILGSPVEQPPAETHNIQKDLSHWVSMCNYYAPESGISAGFMIKPFPRNQLNPDAAYEAYTKELKKEVPDIGHATGKRYRRQGILGCRHRSAHYIQQLAYVHLQCKLQRQHRSGKA